MTDEVHVHLRITTDENLGVTSRVDHEINLMDDVSCSDEDAEAIRATEMSFSMAGSNSRVQDSVGSKARRIPVQCDFNKMKTPVGWMKMLSIVSCIVSLACLFSVDFPSFSMPVPLRFFAFSLVFAFLTTSLLFVLEISSIYRIFIVPWEKWNAMAHILLSVIINGSSSLVVHAIVKHHMEIPLTPNVLHIIIVAIMAGYLCGIFSMFLAFSSCFCYEHHLKGTWRNQRQDGFVMVQQ